MTNKQTTSEADRVYFRTRYADFVETRPQPAEDYRSDWGYTYKKTDEYQVTNGRCRCSFSSIRDGKRKIHTEVIFNLNERDERTYCIIRMDIPTEDAGWTSGSWIFVTDLAPQARRKTIIEDFFENTDFRIEEFDIPERYR